MLIVSLLVGLSIVTTGEKNAISQYACLTPAYPLLGQNDPRIHHGEPAGVHECGICIDTGDVRPGQHEV